MNYLNNATLSYVILIAFLITMLAFAFRLFERDSKNTKYFLVSSIFVLITVIFFGILVLVLPNTEKIVASKKCVDYETAYRNVGQYIPPDQYSKVFQIKIIKDEECETPYLEVRTVSTVLTDFQIFEVSREDRYILHMPPKKNKTLREEAFY